MFFGINDKIPLEFIWKNDKNAIDFIWKNDKVIVNIMKMSALCVLCILGIFSPLFSQFQ